MCFVCHTHHDIVKARLKHPDVVGWVVNLVSGDAVGDDESECRGVNERASLHHVTLHRDN